MINRSFGVSSSLTTNTKTKILFKTSTIDQSFEIVGSSNGCSLIGNGDVLIIHDINIFHAQLPFISNGDLQRVISKFILS